MRTWQLDSSVTPPRLRQGQKSMPSPARGEILIQVAAAAVTPTELSWYPTTHDKSGAPRVDPVPGHEFSGEVAAIGEGVGGMAVGDEVFGMNDWFADGAMADDCITHPQWIARKPATLSHAQAASVPISALTAWQGLLVRGALQKGQCVLIHGASGGVGIFAVQLARRTGAEVIATASARNADFVRGIGADRVIDYRSQRFEELVSDIDLVFDAVGGETLARSWQVLSKSGRLITIAAIADAASDPRVKEAFFIVEPNREQLTQIGDLLENGELTPFVDAVVKFNQIGDAYAGRISNRLGRGKIIVDHSV